EVTQMLMPARENALNFLSFRTLAFYNRLNQIGVNLIALVDDRFLLFFTVTVPLLHRLIHSVWSILQTDFAFVFLLFFRAVRSKGLFLAHVVFPILNVVTDSVYLLPTCAQVPPSPDHQRTAQFLLADRAAGRGAYSGRWR